MFEAWLLSACVSRICRIQASSFSDLMTVELTDDDTIRMRLLERWPGIFAHEIPVQVARRQFHMCK
jgi:hypothetical protein